MASKPITYDKVTECPICLHQLVHPMTLQQCLHNFCKTCIESTNKCVVNGLEGWSCPMCRTFSRKDQLQHNFFIEQVLELENSDPVKVKCGQCKRAQPKWKCKDCKFTLCETCLDIHRSIPVCKNHTIVPFADESMEFVDHIEFCPKHPTEIIKFNCKDCEQVLCVQCKILDHNPHSSEDVETALGRLLPIMQKNGDLLKEKEASLIQYQSDIKDAISKTNKRFDKSKKNFRQNFGQVIDMVNDLIDRRENSQGRHQRQLLDEYNNQLQKVNDQLHQTQHMKQLVDVTTAKARNSSLLCTIQSDLREKLQNSINTLDTKPVKVVYEDTIGIQSSEMDLLKNVLTQFKLYELKDKMYSKEEIIDILQKPLTKQLEVPLPSWCTRVSAIDKKLWVSCNEKQEIHTIDPQTGRVEVIKGKKFIVIKQMINLHIVAGGKDGLYFTKDKGHTWELIADGYYSDLAIDRFTLFALDSSETPSLRVFVYDYPNHVWNELQKFKLDRFGANNMCHSLVHMGAHLFISSNGENKIYKYKLNGEKTNAKCKFDNNTDLCGVNITGHVLTCDFVTGDITMLKCEDLSKVDIKFNLPGIEELRDVAIDCDANVWVLHGSSFSEFHITKYTPK